MPFTDILLLLLCPRTFAQSHCVLPTTFIWHFLYRYHSCWSAIVYSPDDTCQPQYTASYLKKANFFSYTCTGLEVNQLGLCFRTRRRTVSKRQEYTKIKTMKDIMEDERHYFIVTAKLSVAIYFQVQIHQGFIQRPHSEILLHLRIKVTHSTLLHAVT